MGLGISAHGVRYGYTTLVERIAWLQDEFIYGGHVTALGVPAYVFFAAVMLGVSVTLPMLLIGYMAALIVYSADYNWSRGGDVWTNSRRDRYFRDSYGTFRYRMLAYALILAAALIISGSIALVAIVMALALMGISYSAIFKNFTKFVPGFKNVFTSGTWATGSISVVVANTKTLNGVVVILVYMFLFMRSIGNVIYFDVKDIEPDKAEGLKTVPIMLGRERTFKLLAVLNVASFLPLVAGVWAGVLPPLALSLIAIAAFTFYYLKKARAMPYNYLNYLLADLETLLWPLILLIAEGILAL